MITEYNGWEVVFMGDLLKAYNGDTDVIIDGFNIFKSGRRGTFEGSIKLIEPNYGAEKWFQNYKIETEKFVVYYAEAEVYNTIYCIWAKKEPKSIETVIPTFKEPGNEQTVEESDITQTLKHIKPTSAAVSEKMGIFRRVEGLETFIEKYNVLSFKEIWDEYASFMESKYKDNLVSLKPGNSRERIENAVKQLQLKIPDDFLELYTICDGNDTDEWIDKIEETGVAYAHIFGNPLMSIEEIEQEVKGNLNWEKPDESIKSIPAGKVKTNPMLHKKIPIYHDGGGNFFAIDLDPDLHGTYGQIIWVDHEYEEREVFASSLKEFIVIIYFFVKELGVIDNGEGYDGEMSYTEYIDRTV
ncbi:SMI1/KNR4 family protein [Peribacillus asahii]|uniref:Uncharacterized protein n=1 Tax=Peribacillus asahii TaxID=228899 RepID=A0A3T0KMZ7_9BACI|nr:SMI1/KNR4 family protein [Peribacillus asahii]AZV41769.1 hypothetical protein BAOM_1158 [Peribacillus asahii]USK86108.1 SMI1/KNR4 family protein [Peribacillus asahii]